jgi:hypothetical protein
MRTALALAALLALPPPPLAAQGATHLNVAPGQLWEVSFRQDPTASNVYIMNYLTRADGAFTGTTSIPAGKLLILREAQATFLVGPRTAADSLYFRFHRGYGTGGSTWSYGVPRDLLHRVGASATATSDQISFDFRAGMAFTDHYRPRLGVYGPAYLVSNMFLVASGYLVDLPAAQAAAPRHEALAPPSLAAER